MKSDVEKIKWYLALGIVKGIGPARFRQLLSAFKTPENVFEQSRTNLEQVLLPDMIDEILSFDPDKSDYIKAQIELMIKYEVDFVTIDSGEYPRLLREIPTAPPFFFASGKFDKVDEVAIALVGTRKPTYYGKGVVEKLSRELSERGVTIVSGFASGVDTLAHKSCLKSGGRTIAVFGCGLDTIYPSTNKELYDEIKEKGVLVSEYPMGTKPDAVNFPKRNRIISGLSLGTVVIEAGERSGALITSSYALHHNREVFAVPGPVNSPKSFGTNRLIQKGAKLVRNAEDILEEFPFNILPKTLRKQTLQQVPLLNKTEKQVYESLSFTPKHIDNIVKETKMEMPLALSTLLTLELKGLIRQLPGKRFIMV
ncbi:DNA-processing protein DprA [bacterium]|nr:DNA-processing protein DprA [bacterium]